MTGATENTALLNKQQSPSTYTNIEGEGEEEVIVVASSSSSSSSSPLPKVNDDADADQLLKSRLNGSPLFLVLCGLWVGVVLASVDASIVATIYPQIGTEFKRSNEIIWIATAYMLSYTALQPLYGRISDAFGRKTAILFATIVFFIGSAMCGASTNLWTLVISRAIAGIGGGGMNTMSAVITSDLVSLRERGKYQGYANIAYALGSVVGAPLGGIITDTVGWRYCFYINLPFLFISLYVCSYILTNYNLNEQTQQQQPSLSQKFKSIDYLGSFTIVSAVICFLLATSMGGNQRPWSDPLIVSLLISAVLLATLFCIIEAKVAVNPLMPWSIISSRTPLACAFVNLFSVMGSFAMTYTTPLFFQGVLGYKSSQAGLFFLPKIMAMSCGSVASGFWMSKTGEYKKFIMFSTFVAFCAMLGISTWRQNTSFVVFIVCLIMDGFSSGANITTALVAMLSSVGTAEMATITSISYLFRSSGGVIGISATSAIFQGYVKSILTERIKGPDAAEIIEIACKSMNEVRHVLSPEIQKIVIDTYQVSVRYAFYFCIGVSICTFLSTTFIQQFKLHSKVK